VALAAAHMPHAMPRPRCWYGTANTTLLVCRLCTPTFLMRPNAPKWLRSASTCRWGATAAIPHVGGYCPGRGLPGRLTTTNCQAITHGSTAQTHSICMQAAACRAPLPAHPLTSSLQMLRGMPTAYTRFRCTTRTCCKHNKQGRACDREYSRTTSERPSQSTAKRCHAPLLQPCMRRCVFQCFCCYNTCCTRPRLWPQLPSYWVSCCCCCTSPQCSALTPRLRGGRGPSPTAAFFFVSFFFCCSRCSLQQNSMHTQRSAHQHCPCRGEPRPGCAGATPYSAPQAHS
jgi:hypothetical protein